MFSKSLLSVIVLALGTAAHAGPTVKLSSSASLTGGDYSTGGGLTVAMETRAINGKLGLCGVWAQSTSMSIFTRNAAPRVLAKGVATLNGQVITRDFGFLNRVRPASSYTGAPAGCVVLNQAWQPQFATAALQLRIPRQRIFLTSDSRRKNGQKVFFTRSDSTNPALKKGALLPSSVTQFSTGTTQF